MENERTIACIAESIDQTADDLIAISQLMECAYEFLKGPSYFPDAEYMFFLYKIVEERGNTCKELAKQLYHIKE